LTHRDHVVGPACSRGTEDVSPRDRYADDSCTAPPVRPARSATNDTPDDDDADHADKPSDESAEKPHAVSVGPTSVAPDRHDEDDTEPPSDALPAAHAVHDDAPVPDPYVLGGQLRHAGEPAGAYRPLPHDTHVADDVAPSADDAVPVGHAVQLDRDAPPEAVEYVPAGHSEHVTRPAPGAYCPGAHSVQTVAPGAPSASAAADTLPAAQFRHDVCPSDGWYVPAAHAVQLSPDAPATNAPAGAGVHAVAPGRE